MATEKQCYSCGRKGTRGFADHPAGSYNGVGYPAMTLCTNRRTCSRRAQRITTRVSGWCED